MTRAGSSTAGDATVGSLARKRPVIVSAEATVADTAREMRAARTSCALVDDGSLGIVTDRDLRNRVIAEGLPADTPVRTIATRPVSMLPAEAPLEEALLLMLVQDVHHVPVTRDGRIVGTLSDKELLRHQARGPLLLLEQVKSLDSAELLGDYPGALAWTAAELADADVEPVRIARVIASINDALTGRMLRLAEAELGPPPCPYAWMALGSEGRMEQLLLSDQDNALAYRDEGAEAAAYFQALAEKVIGGLLQAGFPPCPGGYMATNWCRSLVDWERTFQGWIDTPDAQSLLEAELFLDVRRVHGDLELDPLHAVLLSAADRPLFQFQLARAALRFTPPLGLFGRIRSDAGVIDVKNAGLAAVVLIGRLAGVTARSLARGTLERLAAGAEVGVFSADTAGALAEAFRFLMRLRLRAQLRSIEAGQPPRSEVELAALSGLEQRWLRDALRAVADAQKGIQSRHRLQLGS